MANENVTIKLNIDASSGVKSLNDVAKSTELSVKSLKDYRNEIKELDRAMSEAAKSGDEKLFNQLSKKMGELKNEMSDFRAKLKYLDPGEILGGWIKFGQGVVGSFGAITGAMQLFGNENEKIEKLEKQSMAIIQTMIGLEQARSILIDQGGVAQLKALAATTAAQIKELFVKRAVITATEEATAAQAGYNAVAMLNPYAILAVAVGALASGIAIYIAATKEATNAEKARQIEIENTKKAIDEANKNSSAEIAQIELLIEKIKNEKTSKKERKKIIEEIEKIMPNVLTGYEKEKLLLGDITESEKKLTEAIYKKALAKAYEGRLEEAINKQLEAKSKVDILKKLEDEYNKQQKYFEKNANAFQKFFVNANKALAEYGLTVEKGVVINDELTRAQKELSDANLRVKVTLQQATNANENFSKNLINTNDNVDNNSEKIKKQSSEISKLNPILAKNVEFTENSTKANKKNSTSIAYILEELTQLNEEEKKFAKELYTQIQNYTLDEIELENEKYQKELALLTKYGYDATLLTQQHEAKINRIKINNAITTSDQINDIYNQALSIMLQYRQEKTDEELSILDQKYTTEEQLLKKQLDSGIITQQKYDEEVSKLKIKQNEETKKIKEKEWQAEHNAAMLRVTTDTVLAIMKGYAQTGPIGGAPLAVIMGAIGAAQLAVIASQKMPKFSQGGYVMGEGNQDTVPALLTPGEFVLKKDIVKQINNGNIIDYNKLAEVINEKRVYVVETDITNVQKKMNKVQTRLTF